MIMTRLAAFLAGAVVLLAGCVASAEIDARPEASEREARTPSASPPPHVEEQPIGSPGRPQLVQDEQAPVTPDLERLAKTFVGYAVGDADTFPHSESVSMALGGQAVVSIDDLSAALANRDTWRICPADWKVYGASSCPVDFLAPVTNAVVNDAVVIYSAEYDDVTCAPKRSGPLPDGHMVILRPAPEWQTCASDFALALVADDQGRLRHVDLTLAEP